MTDRINSITVTSAAIDEISIKGKKTVVLRGVIAPDSLKHLRCDDYQREALPMSSLTDIMAAIRAGETLPDIEIGMRGTRVSGRGDDYVLGDICYIIDGQQRVNAALNVLAQSPGTNVRIGAMIHTATTREWEIERFRILNSLRTKLSPNVLLRNAREKNPAIASLYGLCTNDKAFALYQKVAWGQTMKRGELISALMLLKVSGRLHSHKSAGRSVTVQNLSDQAARLGEVIGNGNVRSNIKEFFEIIDECWGVKLVQYREMAPHMRSTFLTVLAQVFSDHHDFWGDADEKKIAVDIDMRRKLKAFPLQDPSIAALTSAGGGAPALLYQLVTAHLNKGKRHRHLRARRPPPQIDDESEDIAA